MNLNNKGMSMVEVVVGFVLLAIVFASFIKIINLASDMTESSIDIRKHNDDLKNGDYYDGWHKSSDGEFVRDEVDSYECNLNNTSLYKIEDLNNSNANTVYFFAKYVYSRPIDNTPAQEGN